MADKIGTLVLSNPQVVGEGLTPLLSYPPAGPEELIASASFTVIDSSVSTEAVIALSASLYTGNENTVLAISVVRTGVIDAVVTVDWVITGVSTSPSSGTVTFNNSEVQQNISVALPLVAISQTGIITLSNPQLLSGNASAAVLGGQFSATVSVLDVVVNTNKRWSPHHGYKIQGDPSDSNQVNYWSKVTIGIGPTSPVHDSPHLKGVLFGVSWGAIEPTLGVRNWVELDQAMDDAVTNAVQVNMQLTFKNFREDAGLIGPADLSADRLENVNANGTPVNVMAMHRAHVMTRYIEIAIEILLRYGNRAEFEILSSAELLLSFGTGSAPADYSRSALATENKRMHQEVGAVVTPVNFMPNINQLSGEMTDLMESLYINSIGHGSPDLRETPGHAMFKGNTSSDGQVPVRDYRGELGKQSIVSFQDWSFGAFTSVADILSTTIPDYGLTHLYWANQEAGTFTWAELITQLALNPDTLITACPARWPGCIVGVKRWHPGHYFKVQGQDADPDQVSWLSIISTDINNRMQDLDGTAAELKGIQVAMAWGAIETSPGVFDFTDMHTVVDALAALDRYALIMLNVKSFNLSSTLVAPSDITIYEHGGSGWIADIWESATTDRFITFQAAVAAEFDNDPNVEAILLTEAVPSWADAPFVPSGYTVAKLSTELQRTYTAMEADWVETNVAPSINFLSGGNTEILMEKCFDLRIGIAAPDSREVTGWLLYADDPSVSSPRDYRGQCCRIATASESSWRKTDRDAAEVVSFIQLQRATHIAWVGQTTTNTIGEVITWADRQAALIANPGIETDCPTQYSACTFLPPSQSITGISFNFGTLLNIAPGNNVSALESDNYPITWHADGHQYTSFGDGMGFGNLAGNEATRASIGFMRIEGNENNYSAFDVFKSGRQMPDSHNGKCYGILGANGKLYAAWDWRILQSLGNNRGSGADRYEESTICSSSDGGASWTEEIRWNGSDWGIDLNGFYGMSFVNYGQNHGGGRSPKTDNTYIYMTLNENVDGEYECQIPGGIGLIRVLAVNIESGNKADWEYLSGIDINNNPSWDTDLTTRINHFQDVADGNDTTSMSYNEPLGRYIMTTFHKTRVAGAGNNDCFIGFYDAPEPWGPWHTILKTNVQSLGLADGPNVIFWNFSNKWLSVNGLNFVLVGTLLGKDEWGTIEGTFTVGS